MKDDHINIFYRHSSSRDLKPPPGTVVEWE
jgi:hypothetical protein